MLCNHCGGPSEVIDTRFNKATWVTIRKRKCTKCGHKFETREVNASLHLTSDKRVKAFVVAANNRIRERLLQMEIARQLHKGWSLLSEQYGLSRSGVYYAARKGREHIRKERN